MVRLDIFYNKKTKQPCFIFSNYKTKEIFKKLGKLSDYIHRP